jgi:hypothetical protein
VPPFSNKLLSSAKYDFPLFSVLDRTDKSRSEPPSKSHLNLHKYCNTSESLDKIESLSIKPHNSFFEATKMEKYCPHNPPQDTVERDSMLHIRISIVQTTTALWSTRPIVYEWKYM